MASMPRLQLAIAVTIDFVGDVRNVRTWPIPVGVQRSVSGHRVSGSLPPAINGCSSLLR
ncbi:MAG: hypothetical protein RLZ98_1979 [Pseudomonadota bacterium]|jgi:hypothetical protein